MAAALIILFHHGFGLIDAPRPAALNGTNLGELALLMFFGMSGFLVTASWQSQPELRVFARKRALRLMPALLVVVVLTAFALGPLVTTLPLVEYFTSLETYTYVGFNSVLMTWHQDLPGVFEHLGFNNEASIYAVNGSLWTLPVEALAYAAIAAVALVTGRLARWYGVVPIVVGTVAITPFLNAGERLGVPGGPDVTEIIELYVAFSVGALLWLNRERIALGPAHAIVPLALLVIFPTASPWHAAVYGLAVPYLVLVAAFTLPAAFRGLTGRVGDLSYGVYITAYPIQQTIAHVWGPTIKPPAMLLLSAPLALLAARLSWRYVEAPALARKPRAAPATDLAVVQDTTTRRNPFPRYRPDGVPVAAPVESLETQPQTAVGETQS